MLKEVLVGTHLQYILEGPLDEVIENLQKLKEEHSKNFTDLRINIEFFDNGDCDMDLLGKREETPLEAARRISEEEASAKRQREYDLNQLEILKKKYEQNNDK